MDLPITTLKEQQGQSFVAFFLSDLHLSPQSPEHITKLEVFVDEVLELKQSVKIFFLGDVFDLWVGTASPVKLQVQSLLQKLKRLQDEYDSEVFFFEGNHDLHLDVYFQKKWGFQVIKESWHGDLSGLKVHLEHGDLFDPDDKGYLFLRRFLRKSWVRFLLVHIIPDVVIHKVGNFFSQQSSKNTKHTGLNNMSKEREQDIENKLKSYATQKLNQGADVFICGHTHKRNFFELSPQKRLINLGTWQGQPPQVLGLLENQNMIWLKL